MPWSEEIVLCHGLNLISNIFATILPSNPKLFSITEGKKAIKKIKGTAVKLQGLAEFAKQVGIS